MKFVGYLAVGPDGNLYICERNTVAPERFGVFKADTGVWVRDYYGPIAYVLLPSCCVAHPLRRYQTVIPDIDDPEYVYYVNSANYPALVKAKV